MSMGMTGLDIQLFTDNQNGNNLFFRGGGGGAWLFKNSLEAWYI